MEGKKHTGNNNGLLDQAIEKFHEKNEYLKNLKVNVPSWYVGWILAQDYKHKNILEKRPPEFVFQALKYRRAMKRILDDPIKFCLTNPTDTYS